MENTKKTENHKITVIILQSSMNEDQPLSKDRPFEKGVLKPVFVDNHGTVKLQKL